MTQLARQEYAAALRGRYGIATKKEKSGILDEFCRVTGCHRKAAIHILRRHRLAPVLLSLGYKHRLEPKGSTPKKGKHPTLSFLTKSFPQSFGQRQA